MGCDGGTIPTRDELVRLKKKPEQKDKNAELAAKWDHCALTQQLLQRPIVACQLGRLYNKDSVIELLLDRSKFESAAEFEHIKGLKDVRTLTLTDNPSYNREGAADLGDQYVDHQMGRFICPITGLEMTGRYRFCYMLQCGHVFSERAMKEVQSTTCHTCGIAITDDDVIVLNPTEEEIDHAMVKMADRKAKAKLEKKKAKKKKLEETTETASTSNGVSEPKKVKFAAKDKEVLIPKVNGKAKKVSEARSAAATSSNSSATNGTTEKSAPPTGKPNTIQSDPKASAAFKSLFTTSSACKNQQKAHWVTHNPGYY